MEESPRSMRRTLEENLDCKAQFISMELVMQKISSGWEDSPRMRRGVQMSLEAQEEFEFTMSNLAAKADLYEPAMEASPADELFFRGQLLPLEHDPRLQLVHTLSGMQRGHHFEDSLVYKSAAEEQLSMKLAYAEAFPYAAPLDEDGFVLHPGFEEGLPLQMAKESSCVQEGITSNTTRSNRADGGLDTSSKIDSRSSSFRSQQSSYWGSGEKDSRDSSSSSRCSNGSSQDGSLHGSERRAHHNKAMPTSRLNNTGNADDKEEHHAPQHGKPPLPSSKVKKWSWKAFFTGLRRASKIWVDDRAEEHNQNAMHRDANRQRKPRFGFVSTMQASRGVERGEYEGQFGYAGGGTETRKARHQQGKVKGLGNEEYGGHMNSKYFMGNGGYKGYYYEGSHGGRPGKEKPRLGIIAWNARESWQRWVKKPLYGKLSNTHRHSMHVHEDIHPSFPVKAKSLSSTPLAKSPVRRADNVAHTPDFYGASTSKYVNVGFAASCPASMRSSPHHSGVLAVVNKSPPPSSLHDLHTAIQGAIAHCKQSQSTDPP